VLADLVGADEDAFVTAMLRNQCQADTGVSRGGFNNGAARLELAAGLGGVDHLRRDPVFGAAARIQIFDFCHHGARVRRDDGVQATQWRAADEVTEVLRNPHAFIVSGQFRPRTPAPAVSTSSAPSRAPGKSSRLPGGFAAVLAD